MTIRRSKGAKRTLLSLLVLLGSFLLLGCHRLDRNATCETVEQSQMEREAFFQALPFLTPSASGDAWPPRIQGALGNDAILKNHMVSVEPKNSEPACFESHHGVDPAMFPLDVCIMTTVVEEPYVIGQQGKVTSPAASSVSTSLSLSQSPKIPSQGMTVSIHENKRRTTERMHVVLRIDRKSVFQVDFAQFRGIHLHEKHSDDGVSNLVLHFDSCSFRIFNEEALAKDGASDDDYGMLKTAASRLKKAASAYQRLSIFQGNVDYLTPLDQNTDSSRLSTSDPTVQHGNYRNSQVAHSSNDDAPGEDRVREGTSSGEGARMRHVKRKHSALARSWNGLHSLQAVLELPHDAAEPDDGAIADIIGPLLTTAAEELGSSYCRRKDLRDVMQSCNNDIQSCEAQLNDVFTAGFPPPTRNRRNAASPAKTACLPEEDTDVLLETAQMILKKQKHAVKERLELLLLPTRE